MFAFALAMALAFVADHLLSLADLSPIFLVAVMAVAARRRMPELLKLVRQYDPDALYTITDVKSCHGEEPDAAARPAAGEVRISPAVVNNLGVRTEPVVRGSLPLPDGVQPRRVTVQVQDAPGGKTLGMRVMLVK